MSVYRTNATPEAAAAPACACAAWAMHEAFNDGDGEPHHPRCPKAETDPDHLAAVIAQWYVSHDEPDSARLGEAIAWALRALPEATLQARLVARAEECAKLADALATFWGAQGNDAQAFAAMAVASGIRSLAVTR